MTADGVALDFPEIDRLIDGSPIPPRGRISASLENLRTFPPKLPPHRHSCHIHRFASQEARRKSTSSRRRSSSVASHHRKHSRVSNRQKKWMSEEQRAKERRRRRVVLVVVGTFLFILFSCVLVVIVTLTHQVDHFKKNNGTSTVYYTFTPLEGAKSVGNESLDYSNGTVDQQSDFQAINETELQN